jgi:hypothetical protein
VAATAINNFLLSFAAAVAALAPVELAGQPRELWVHNAVEDEATNPFTVLRIYRGSEPGAFAGMRVALVSVQADTRGGDSQAVLALAWKLHESLLDDQGRPRMHWTIPGKRFAADGSIEVDPGGAWHIRSVRFLNAPGVIGRDEKDRWMATGNFDLDFERA